jgi:hypothetical protein
MAHRMRFIIGFLASAVALAIAAAPASAQNFTCEASAVRGQVLTVPPIEPIRANAGGNPCRTNTAGGALELPIAVGALALGAQTSLAGPANAPAQQTAGATGGIADLRVKALPDLPIQLPIDQVAQNLPTIAPITLPGGLATINVDIRQALLNALPNGRLPNVDLVRVQAGVAFAQARCVNGRPQLTGSSRVAGVQVLGQDTPLNQVVTQAVEVIGGGSVDPSNLNLSDVDISVLGGAVAVDSPAVLAAVDAALDQLPTVTLPAALAEIRIAPGGQERTATSLVQRALDVDVSILGTKIADLTIGEARVGMNNVNCAPPAQGVAQSALQCTTRRLVLVDVLPGSRRVQLYGAADRRFVGRTVNIVFQHTRRTVARARVRQDGTFRTSAAMPSRRIRGTNRARYQARIGRERSLDLKLQRRMIVRSVRVSGGRVRITGRVSRPLARPVRSIEVRRRVSCRRTVVVARIKPNRRGTFSVSVPAPPNQQAAVYRFATRVRKTSRNPKTFPTFTLPRYVDLGRS